MLNSCFLTCLIFMFPQVLVNFTRILKGHSSSLVVNSDRFSASFDLDFPVFFLNLDHYVLCLTDVLFLQSIFVSLQS